MNGLKLNLLAGFTLDLKDSIWLLGSITLLPVAVILIITSAILRSKKLLKIGGLFALLWVIVFFVF